MGRSLGSFAPILPALLLGGLVPVVRGQILQQQFSLQPGWNTVFLEVDPVPSAANTVFVTTPANAIERVWTWRPASDDARWNVINPEDPNLSADTQTAWRLWLPPTNPTVFLSSLLDVSGGQVYLISCTQAATLTVRGVPDDTKTRWQPGFNVAGFYVDQAPPSFQTYLAPSAPHAGAKVFTLGASGALTAVANLSTPITAGRGFWVSCGAFTTYDGPLSINPLSLSGLIYNRFAAEKSLQFENLASAARTVTMDFSPSAAPPPTHPANAGPVPLRYRAYSLATPAVYELNPLSQAQPATFQVEAGGEQGAVEFVQVSVARAGLAPAVLDPNGGGSTYQSLLAVRDGQGFRRWLPVAAEVGGRAGLYVGTVEVDRVAWVQADARIVGAPPPGDPYLQNDPNVPTNPNPDTGSTTEPRKTPWSFEFPIIVHFDGAGNYRLLSEVAILYKPAAGGEPGRYVLATPSCDGCDALRAGSLIDGEPFGPRIASANFSFRDDLVPATVNGGFDGQIVFETVVSKDDRLNPFLHRFHPDHDGDRPGEVFDIRRTITLNFSCPPETGVSTSPGAGDSRLRGCYQETIGGVFECSDEPVVSIPCPDNPNNEYKYIPGLHKRDINVSGRFDLRRVTDIAALNNP